MWVNNYTSHCSFFDIEDIEVNSNLKKRKVLAQGIAEMVFKLTNKAIDFSYIFTDDIFLLEMNKERLNHDTLTDIISFDLSDAKSNIIKGEFYISAERVKYNAHFFKLKFQEELLRVILHGALHLCGFKDKNTTQIKEMRKAEEQWMKYINDLMIKK
jgi:rRNA maturation RNase YbeY